MIIEILKHTHMEEHYNQQLPTHGLSCPSIIPPATSLPQLNDFEANFKTLYLYFSI